MMSFTDLASVPGNSPEPFDDRLRLAVAAYLARFKGSSREHTESDLRCYLTWCVTRSMDPLAAKRPHLELYIRWMQEVRRFKPSTVSRRFSVTAGFYRTCVLDGILEHSPAAHVRRPSAPAESPTLGYTHLQFEALLTAARQSPNPYDFALVAMLGLLGLRIFEATSADIADLGEEHGHRVLRVCGKGTKIVLVPLPPAVGRAVDRAVGSRTRGPVLLNSRGARMDRHAATRRLRWLAETAGIQVIRAHPHMLRHTLVICTAFRPEARRNPGLAASCLMSIRYSVRYVRQGRYQGLSLFAAAFDLTWLTCLSSQNGHLPGILRSPVQITLVTTMLDAGVDLRDVQIAARHARTTMRYDRARQNLDRHPNYILAAYMASGT